MDKIFLRRGALIFAAFSVASGAAVLLSGKAWLCFMIIAGFVLICALGMIFCDKSKSRRMAYTCSALCLAAAILGALSAGRTTEKTAVICSLFDGEMHSLSGKVTYESYSESFGAGYCVETECGGIYLEIPFAFDASTGDEISFVGTFSPLEEDRGYLRSEGTFAFCEVASASISRIGRLSVFQRLNSFFRGVFFDKLPGDSAKLASAVFLGNRDDIDAKTKLSFTRSGVAHLLALSGLHLSIVSLSVDFLLSVLRVKKKIRIAVTLLFIAGFAVITGLSPSVFRAAIMLGFLCIAELFGERADPLTSLCASLAVIFAVRPYAVWDAGLWLSFSATFGIVCFSDELTLRFASETRETYSKRKDFLKKIAKYFYGILSVSAIATAFTLPITYLLFGGISLVSPVTNIVAIPLMTLILFGLILLCALFWVPLVSGAISSFCGFVSSLLIKVVSAFSSVNGVYISIRYPFAPYLIAALFLCILLILFVPKIKKKYVFAAVIASCVAFACCFFVYSELTKDEIYTVCINSGQNDAVGMVYRGKSVVLDVSSGGFSAPYEAISETGGRKADELDAFVLTHLHSNHIRTLEKLTGYVKINLLVLPYPEISDEYGITAELERIAAENGIELIYYDRSTQSYLDIAELTVELPGYFRVARSTHPAISFSVTLDGNPAFMYIGSALHECAGSPRSYDSTVIFFGAHGPVMKSAPKKEMCNAECCLYSNEEVCGFFGSDENVISSHGGKITLIIEK